MTAVQPSAPVFTLQDYDGVSLQDRVTQKTFEPETIRIIGRFGYGRFTPHFLQALHSSRFLLLCMCLCSVFQGFIVNGHIPVIITTLEKRFQFSSMETGLFAAMYDIAVLLFLIPVGHYGNKGHKGRCIGVGMLFMAAGSFLMLIPQFASGNYQVGELSTNGSTCSAEKNTESCASSDRTNDHYWLFVFLLGNFLVGIGGSPLWTLGITYLDENVSQKASAMYLGLFNASGGVGPAIGFILSGTLLQFYGDPGVDWKKSGLKEGPNDPRWYGAWWIGFIFSALTCFAISFPMLAFAKELPEAARHRKKDVDQSSQSIKTEYLSHKAAHVPRRVLNLLRNVPFTALIVVQTVEALVVNGTVTFLPKYMENMFSLSSGQAGILSGIIIVPSAIVGNILGGILLRKWPMKVRGMLLTAATCFFGAIIFALGFFSTCDESLIAGVNSQYFDPQLSKNISDMSTLSACNSQCNCDSKIFDPICDSGTALTFVSPCHGACESETDKGFGNCSCSATVNPEAVFNRGVCKVDCSKNMILFLISVVIFSILKFMALQPIQQSSLRCVPFDERTLAITLSWMFMRLLGTIPGALLFGSAIDSVCILNTEKCGKSSCVRYNGQRFATYFFGFTLIGKITSIAALAVAWKLYKPASTLISSTDAKF